LRKRQELEEELNMKRVYLFFAIVGAVVPYLYFIDFFSQEGINLPNFVSALFVNGAAAGFTTDLLITSMVFWIYMFVQRNQGRGPSPIPFILINLAIGLSCAVPAYLFTIEE
jgi:polyferredoxin